METCQICFEDFATTTVPDTPADPEVPATTDSDVLFVNGQLCGPACPAKICQTCLLGHLRASLDACYAGVLPRIRCPICLTRLNKSQWIKHLTTAGAEDASGVTDKYITLCQKACSLQSPCCHKIGYSHLPEFMPSDDAIDGANEPTHTVKDDSEKALAFLNLCREFCFHKVDGRTVVQFAIDHFSPKEPIAEPETPPAPPAKSVHEIVEETLTRITDDERRATLLLSYLYLRPKATTRCCKRDFCFNCKRNGHHDTCDVEEIVLNTCVLQCRSCRVMIVKVEGCDSVTCMCGYSMGWERELQIQSLNQRGLIGVDILDRDLFLKWEQWRQKLRGWTGILTQRMQERERRIQALEWLATYASLLRRHFGDKIWRFKARCNHTKFQSELFWTAYDRSQPQDCRAQTTEDVMAELFAIDIVAK